MDIRETLQARLEKIEAQMQKFGKPYGYDAEMIYRAMCEDWAIIKDSVAQIDGALPNEHLHENL